MFVEKHSINDIGLTFIKSANIQAYPCGRRRSELVDSDGSIETVDDKYYIPFDPEARLNTEANNRKHSGLNGFTQTYLTEWEDDQDNLLLALAGYLFKIKLDNNYKKVNDFGNAVVTQLSTLAGAQQSSAWVEPERIYANILLEDTALFQGFMAYNTSVLRNQTDSSTPEVTLDLLTTPSRDNASLSDIQDFNNYYFSGLSFSAEPLSGVQETHSTTYVTKENGTAQQIDSLCILEKDNETGAWVVHQPAYLPKIEHGDEVDSIKVKAVFTEKLVQKDIPVPSMQVVGNDDDGYQLQFFLR